MSVPWPPEQLIVAAVAVQPVLAVAAVEIVDPVLAQKLVVAFFTVNYIEVVI